MLQIIFDADYIAKKLYMFLIRFCIGFGGLETKHEKVKILTPTTLVCNFSVDIRFRSYALLGKIFIGRGDFEAVRGA